MDGDSKPRWSNALIFHSVLILLLSCFQTGEAAHQYQPVLVSIGITDDVTLPCHVEPATNAADEMLEWSRPDLNPRFVHVRRDGEDLLVDQNPSYVGRTSVFVDRLKQGNMSLRLSRLRLSDEGTYRCFSPGLNTDSTVQLVVATVIETNIVSAGVLECKSAGWYPQPEVLWLDGEGNLLSAGPTETVRGPDDLYTVSSRVTVEKRHSNNFTCRVQQNNEHRDAKIHVPDDFFVGSSNSVIPAVISLVVFVLVVLAFGLFAWKRTQNKFNTKKNPEDGESQSGDTATSKPPTKPPRDDSERKPLIRNEKEGEERKAETASASATGADAAAATTGADAAAATGADTATAAATGEDTATAATTGADAAAASATGADAATAATTGADAAAASATGADAAAATTGADAAAATTGADAATAAATGADAAATTGADAATAATTGADAAAASATGADAAATTGADAAAATGADAATAATGADAAAATGADAAATGADAATATTGADAATAATTGADAAATTGADRENVMLNERADQTNENMNEGSTKNSDTTGQNLPEGGATLKDPSAAETSPAAVDSETDKQSVNSKDISETNPEDGEEATNDTPKEEDEDKTQAADRGTEV